MPIPQDSKIVIAMAGIIGDKIVEIYPGIAQTPIIAIQLSMDKVLW